MSLWMVHSRMSTVVTPLRFAIVVIHLPLTKAMGYTLQQKMVAVANEKVV